MKSSRKKLKTGSVIKAPASRSARSKVKKVGRMTLKGDAAKPGGQVQATVPVLSRPYAVITGASSGIGYELAKVFAKNGHDLLVAAEDGEIHEASNAFRALGGIVDVCQCDLSTREGVEKLYAAILESGRPVEALVLNAGVGVGGEFLETDLDRELAMIQLNIVSMVHLSKLVLPDMAQRKSGKVLMTSSVAASMPGPYYAVYAATKAFVQSFAEAIRFEVASRGIHVTALQPGPTDTNFFARAHMINTPAGQSKKDDAATVAEQGYKALMGNQDHVVAGSFMNTAQTLVGKLVPETVGATLHSRSTRPNDLKRKTSKAARK